VAEETRMGLLSLNALEAGLRSAESKRHIRRRPDRPLRHPTHHKGGAWGAPVEGRTYLLEKAVAQTLTAFVCEALSNVRVYSGVDIDWHLTRTPPTIGSGRYWVPSWSWPFFEAQWRNRVGHSRGTRNAGSPISDDGEPNSNASSVAFRL